MLSPNFAYFCTTSTSSYEILFLFLNLDMVPWLPWNSTSGGFAFIWQSKWVGIIAIKTGRTQIHFRNDVLVDVASWLRARRDQEKSRRACKSLQHCKFWHFNIWYSDTRSGFSASGWTEVFVKTLTGSPLPAVLFRLRAFFAGLHWPRATTALALTYC